MSLVMGYHVDIAHFPTRQRTRQFAQAPAGRAADAGLREGRRGCRYLVVNATQIEEWQRPGEDYRRTSMSLAPNQEITQVTRAEDLKVLAGGSVYKEEANYHPEIVRRPLPRGHQGAARTPTRRADRFVACAMFDTTAWRTVEADLKVALERRLRCASTRRPS